MAFLIINDFKQRRFVVIPYRRPKGESLTYASGPVQTFPPEIIETEIFQRISSDRLETKVGAEREEIQPFALSVEDEKKLLSNASAIRLDLKKIIGGYSDVYRFAPCVIAQRRVHRILDRDPNLNIEVPYPMTLDTFSIAFRRAFERANE
jgi:hypothetical protein